MSKHWWAVLEAFEPGSMPDDADTRPFAPPNDLHVPSEWVGDGDGCGGEVCGYYPCSCEDEPEAAT